MCGVSESGGKAVYSEGSEGWEGRDGKGERDLVEVGAGWSASTGCGRFNAEDAEIRSGM